MLSITFVLADERVITVSARPGQSLMEAALIGGVPGIIADCGGGAVCGTCHIHVDAGWSDQVGPAKDAEEDTLDAVYEPGPASRLSCQIILREELDGLIVRVPARQAS
jgi:2Fe-2S ferredoxin